MLLGRLVLGFGRGQGPVRLAEAGGVAGTEAC